MRALLLCTALCVIAPGGLQASTELAPAQAAFAYSARHPITALPDEAFEHLRPDEVITVELREDADHVVVAPPVRVPRRYSRQELCSAAASVAQANNLPVPFFANLIQQESAWRTHVVSPAGAQGVAQFMPFVARAYGLQNPFDPIHALRVSGKFVAELFEQFGNIGLAAAAYNAGPGRVQSWMTKRGKLPQETRDYVKNITGQPAERWAKARKLSHDDIRLPAHARCTDSRTLEAQAAERDKVIQVAAAPKPAKADAKKKLAAKIAAKKGGAKETSKAAGFKLASADGGSVPVPAPKPAKESAKKPEPAKPAAKTSIASGKRTAQKVKAAERKSAPAQAAAQSAAKSAAKPAAEPKGAKATSKSAGKSDSTAPLNIRPKVAAKPAARPQANAAKSEPQRRVKLATR